MDDQEESTESKFSSTHRRRPKNMRPRPRVSPNAIVLASVARRQLIERREDEYREILRQEAAQDDIEIQMLKGSQPETEKETENLFKTSKSVNPNTVVKPLIEDVYRGLAEISIMVPEQAQQGIISAINESGVSDIASVMEILNDRIVTVLEEAATIDPAIDPLAASQKASVASSLMAAISLLAKISVDQPKVTLTT
jgi:DUF438 domain-containing protein